MIDFTATLTSLMLDTFALVRILPNRLFKSLILLLLLLLQSEAVRFDSKVVLLPSLNFLLLDERRRSKKQRKLIFEANRFEFLFSRSARIITFNF